MSGRIVTNVLAIVRQSSDWRHSLGGTINLAGKLSLRAMLGLCRARMRLVVSAAPRVTTSAEHPCPLLMPLT
jgi:hypothetical protein